MRQFDVTDEAMICAPRDTVYGAFVDEMNGKTTWWAPHHSFQLLSGDSFDSIGARLESRVRTKWPIKYTTETVEAVASGHIRVRYIGGSFRGEADWTFEDVEGNTRVGCHWQTTPAGSLRLMARFLPVEKSHSDVTMAGFEKLEAFLN